MNNVTVLKSSKTESPKTPGGISKSLLTPCRRVGLSRNWKKVGPSPFVSPLAGNSPSHIEVKVEKKETRKRKEPAHDEESEDLVETSPKSPIETEGSLDRNETESEAQSEGIESTPIRHVALPRKKKSKLISNLRKTANNFKAPLKEAKIDIKVSEKADSIDKPVGELKQEVSKTIEKVATPTRKKSLSKSKKSISPAKPTDNNKATAKNIETKENLCNTENSSNENNKKSPNNLTKECVVVIQKKIFKKVEDSNCKDNNLNNFEILEKESELSQEINISKDNKLEQKGKKDIHNKQTSLKEKITSQTIFDSDSDDIPLCQIKENGQEVIPEPIKVSDVIVIDDEHDFTATKKIKVKKLDKITSTGGLANSENKLSKKQKLSSNNRRTEKVDAKASQNSFEDDDDFEFDTKRTILIRKSYDKVSKPTKARTTGSITHKDIEDLKARIEMKKKLLLAKSMTEETQELRDLIKKWQRGCQDALMELMDLMKSKCPEKNMDYGEMLQMLKIPYCLVGYDEENDCFNTPEDSNIILSNFNDVE